MVDERFFDRLYELHDGDDVRRHYDRFADDQIPGLGSQGWVVTARRCQQVP